MNANTATPAASAAQSSGSATPVIRSAPEQRIPPGVSARETQADFRSLLDADPGTPNTRPPKRREQRPATGGETADDITAEDLGELEGARGKPERRDRQPAQGDPEDVEDDRTEQRDDDAPNDPDADHDPDAGDPDEVEYDENGDPIDHEAEDEALLQRRIKIKADGKDEHVTVAELKAGYQRHADYSRKTEEVARVRETHVAGLSALAEQQSALDGLLLHVAQTMEQNAPRRPTSEEWDRLSVEAPLDFARLRAHWENYDRKMQEVVGLQQANRAAMQRQGAERFSHVVAGEAQRLFKIAPRFAGESGKALKGRLVAYAQANGITPQELASVVKAEGMIVLEKAMLYDEAVQRSKTRKAGTRVTRQPQQPPRTEAKPVREAPRERPRSAPPGAANTSERRQPSKLAQAKNRLRQSGSMEDASAAIAELL
jgi:hypothetical protein